MKIMSDVTVQSCFVIREAPMSPKGGSLLYIIPHRESSHTQNLKGKENMPVKPIRLRLIRNKFML